MTYKINWNRRRYTESEFIDAWNSSATVSECARRLNVKAAGGNFFTLTKTAHALGLSKEHFTGKPLERTKKGYSKTKPLEEILVEDSSYTSTNALRNRLIREGVFPAQCSNCKRTEWIGEDIPLELDHINGVSSDHRIENLRILCPNCHALTPTYRGKNIRGGQRVAKKDKCGCGREKSVTSIYCQRCYQVGRVTRKYSGAANPSRSVCACGNAKSERAKVCMMCNKRAQSAHVPPVEELLSILESVSWNMCKAGRHYKVSDNAVRKWVNKYELSRPDSK